VILSKVPEILAAQLIFAILLPFVVFAPVRWAVLAWLIMGNLDGTGPGSAALTNFGWLNAAKGVGIPLLLCWRLRAVPSASIITIPARLWIALTLYACIGSLWSPFPLAAAKLVGNMAGILLAVVILEKAARAGILDTRVLVILIVATLTLGGVQTYIFAGELYGYDGADQPLRFSSFVFAQQYAAILVAFLSIVLWRISLSKLQKGVLLAGVSLALILNGSRTWFLGAVIVLVIYSWIYFRGALLTAAFVSAGACFCGLLLLNLSPWGARLSGDAPSRIMATVNAIVSGEDTPQRAGLRDLSFRFIVYSAVMDELRTATVYEILFGHGSSSGATVSLRILPSVYNADRLDANRTIHNEWLRALYEWGIVGLVLLVGVFLSLVVGVFLRMPATRWKAPLLALISFLPAFLVALSTENVLAGAGNAVTISLALMIGLLWSPAPKPFSERWPVDPGLSLRKRELCRT
jgi:hypothetical protein